MLTRVTDPARIGALDYGRVPRQTSGESRDSTIVNHVGTCSGNAAAIPRNARKRGVATFEKVGKKLILKFREEINILCSRADGRDEERKNREAETAR